MRREHIMSLGQFGGWYCELLSDLMYRCHMWNWPPRHFNPGVKSLQHFPVVYDFNPAPFYPPPLQGFNPGGKMARGSVSHMTPVPKVNISIFRWSKSEQGDIVIIKNVVNVYNFGLAIHTKKLFGVGNYNSIMLTITQTSHK